MDEAKKAAWARMVKAKCQYCKYFGKHGSSKYDCAWFFYWDWLPLITLKTQECHKYEWDSRLTKKDFVDYE